ncbi:MAG: hypothetical protein F4Z82_18360 [Caldilineaceae bacterium SB0668_bin_21]|nr:hypothetical protein [Caldilineaceae bacterium SB0668_bin_21]
MLARVETLAATAAAEPTATATSEPTRLLTRVETLAATAAAEPTATATATSIAVPAAPQNVRASVEGDKVTLTWGDPGDGSVTGYRIERRGEDPADPFVTLVEDSGSASTQYVDSSAAPEMGYVYRVRAISAAGASEPSAEVGVNPLPAPTVVPSDPDRGVLVALYNATDGDNWTMRTNWQSGRPIGEWYGVTTDGGGRVTGLALSDNGLNGSIPAALGSLGGMAWLDLRRNRLSGSIPAALGDLSNLSHLYLDGNPLTGCVPTRLRSVPSNDFSSLGLPFCQEASASTSGQARLISGARVSGNLSKRKSTILETAIRPPIGDGLRPKDRSLVTSHHSRLRSRTTGLHSWRRIPDPDSIQAASQGLAN